MNAEVFINGVLLGATGRLSPPVSRMRHYPVIRGIPPSLLRLGDNSVEIILSLEPTSVGAVSTIEIGPTATLAGKHGWRRFVQISLIQLSSLTAGVLILVIFTVYGGRGRGSSYQWFQVSIGLWIIYASEIWIIDSPLAPQHWEAVANGAQYLSVWAVMLGFHRALDRPRPGIEIGSFIAIVGVIIALATIPPSWVWPARAFLGIGLCVLAGYLVDFVRGTDAAQEWVLNKTHVAGGLFGMVAGLHDIASAYWGWPASGFWLTPLTGAIAIFLTLVTILRHFMSTISESSALGQDLEAKVEEREHALTVQYRRLQAFERDRLLERERERLARRLHEGVGSVLMSTIASVEASQGGESMMPLRQTADRIRDALDDLRLVIDSLRPDDALLDMLARLRSRLAARFERRDILVEWRVDDIPPLRGFGVEHALHLLRILQDGLRGPERVAGTRRVVVRTGPERRGRSDGIYVEIEDDGADELPRPEHPAMRDRARSLGGEVSIDRMQSATHVRLWLPLQLEPATTP